MRGGAQARLRFKVGTNGMASIYLDRARRYQKAIRLALLKEWDPIGVGDIPEAQDEYDSYVYHIYGLLIRRRPKQEIVDYLWELETEQMGLPGNWQRAEWFAERLLLIAKQMDEDSEATPPPGSPT